MPPQKNSGNKGAKRETNASVKNRKFIQNFIDDLKTDGEVEHVHIGRVLRKLGDGRMEVFYTKKVGKNNELQGRVTQAVIRGSFRGRGKHSVWIDVGSFVAIAETGINGPSAFEIVSVMSNDQIRDIAKQIDIDPRILAIDNVDTDKLVSNKPVKDMTEGFEFDGQDDEEEVDIENI